MNPVIETRSITRSASSSSPTNSHRVIQLDFVRGLAILAVMEVHFLTVPVANPMARAFEYLGKQLGGMGVDLFFVLSGFLVGGLLVQELIKTGTLRTRRFLLRRIFKIWPAYYLYILFQICVRRHPLNTFAWQNILNIQNYAGTSLSHTWSLAIEEHFYLLLPLLLAAIHTRPRLRPAMPSILLGLCLLVLAGRLIAVYAFHQSDLQWYTHTRLDSLLFGVILSCILYQHRALFERILQYRLCLLLIFVAGPLFDLLYPFTSPPMDSLGYTVNYISLAALLLLVYGYRGSLIRTRPYRAVAWIGVYSYGIYLWHLSVREPLTALATRLPPSIQWPTLLISQYLAAIALGALLTRAIELPMLRLRDRLIPRGPAQPPPEEA